jgi:hypothetical protein
MCSGCIYNTPKTEVEKLAILAIITATIYILNYLLANAYAVKTQLT